MRFLVCYIFDPFYLSKITVHPWTAPGAAVWGTRLRVVPSKIPGARRGEWEKKHFNQQRRQS
ncbi:MAG: hypothetical protein ABFS02_09475 [Pseudomonadota bacterium]